MLHLIGDREYLHLYHLTPKKNKDRIETVGLQTKRSQGALEVIWFCEQSALAWAIKHLAVHHGCKEEDMRVFKVLLPRWTLTYRGRGCYLCHNDIPAFLLATHVMA